MMLLLASSCEDNLGVQVTAEAPNADKTLYQIIMQDKELTDFVEILDACNIPSSKSNEIVSVADSLFNTSRLEAERVPKTEKLLKLTIDTGIDKRVIVSGIAEQYSPEEMIGKQICILANLAPRKIRGIESKGMILMARQNDGKMRFITPAETLCNGAEIG